jgi:TolB-like protein/Tfp pilus assembly protein PilF
MTIWSAEIKELESLYTSIKGRFPELEKDLEHLIKTDDENVALLYSRRCLEIIVTDLCESELKRPRKTEPLKGIIDKLHREEKVPDHIITSMDHLNTLSTYGTHPKEFDPEQVRPVLINLTTIIKWYLKYKTEKDESVRKEKVVEYPDERSADIKESVHIHKSRKNPLLIVSGTLIIAIILYIVIDQFNLFRKDKFEDIKDPEGKISIAVMPFENLTGDTTLNYFQRGISSLIINGLGTSSELAVCDDQTMFEVMESMNQVYTAGISPSMAKEIAKKVKAETYISGSFQGRGDTYWILVNLVNTENGKIIWTDKIEGDLKSSDYLILADSLCNEIKNYLEIKALEKVADYDFREAYPNSAEAYRYFIEGTNLILTQNYESGIKWLKKALEIDSTFTFASFYIALAYNYNYQPEQELWIKKAYATKDQIPPEYQLWLDLWYACLISKNLQDVYLYCNLLEESGINSRLLWYDIGLTYTNFYCDYPPQIEKAIKAFEKVMEISLERGGYWKYERYYENYGFALHKAGVHEKEEGIYEIGLSVFPESDYILFRQAVCALSMGDTSKANEYLAKLIPLAKELNYSESAIERALGQIYEEANILDQAEEHYRKAYELEPQNINRILHLAALLIDYDINVNEGMELVQKGLTIQPDNSFLLWCKGLGYYKQGKYEEAIQFLIRAEEIIGLYSELCKDLHEAEQALANQNK